MIFFNISDFNDLDQKIDIKEEILEPSPKRMKLGDCLRELKRQEKIGKWIVKMEKLNPSFLKAGFLISDVVSRAGLIKQEIKQEIKEEVIETFKVTDDIKIEGVEYTTTGKHYFNYLMN